VKLRVQSPARLVPEARRHDDARRLHMTAPVYPRLGVTLQLGQGLVHGAVVSLTRPCTRKAARPGWGVVSVNDPSTMTRTPGSSESFVVGLPDTLFGYVGVVDFWVPANRIQVQSPKVTTEEEQKALWRRLVGKR
jgi:hypothetical protein